MKGLTGQRHSELPKRDILKAAIRGKINVSHPGILPRPTVQWTNYKSVGPIMTGEAEGSRRDGAKDQSPAMWRQRAPWRDSQDEQLETVWGAGAWYGNRETFTRAAVTREVGVKGWRSGKAPDHKGPRRSR